MYQRKYVKKKINGLPRPAPVTKQVFLLKEDSNDISPAVKYEKINAII